MSEPLSALQTAVREHIGRFAGYDFDRDHEDLRSALAASERPPVDPLREALEKIASPVEHGMANPQNREELARWMNRIARAALSGAAPRPDETPDDVLRRVYERGREHERLAAAPGEKSEAERRDEAHAIGYREGYRAALAAAPSPQRLYMERVADLVAHDPAVRARLRAILARLSDTGDTADGAS